MAQSADLTTGDLSGIDAVALGISQITPDGVQCGLDPARLLQVARQTLDNSGILIRDDATTRLTLSTITARETYAATEVCATATMLGAYRPESFFSAQKGWLQTGYVVVWQRALVQSTPAVSHPSAAAAAVRRVVAQFLADRDAQRHQGADAGTKKSGDLPTHAADSQTQQ